MISQEGSVRNYTASGAFFPLEIEGFQLPHPIDFVGTVCDLSPAASSQALSRQTGLIRCANFESKPFIHLRRLFRLPVPVAESSLKGVQDAKVACGFPAFVPNVKGIT